ncbi:MAG: hypothetical protein LBI36_04705 [Oscillospiraceae bacterium]|jgi:undecaprenyl pyrophosphate phosphatase UppP|nr:hypothetical protein [Oscillospiraceae bacterium]
MKNKSKRNIIMNIVVPAALVVVLSVYFTVKSMWGLPQIIILALLLMVSGFYFWLWRCCDKSGLF